MHLKRSDAILVEYYEHELVAIGRPAAIENLRQVIIKGIDFLVRNPATHKTRRVQAIISSVRQGLHNEMIEDMSAQVQDIAKRRDGSCIACLQVGGQEICFLPDVDIPKTETTTKEWRAFLQRLAPSARTARDTQTGLENRIPFRNGIWLADMVFLPQASFSVIPDITTIAGDVYVKSMETVRHNNLVIQGNLHMPTGMLALEASPVAALHGDLYLYDNDQTLSARDLVFAPEALENWGLTNTRLLILNSGAAYGLVWENGKNTPEKKTAFLEERSSIKADGRAPRFVWTTGSWQRVGASLPVEFANAVRMKIGRIRVHLQLGADLLPNHTDFNVPNLEKISSYLELCKTALYNGQDALTTEDRRIVHEMQEDIDVLKTLCAVDDVLDDPETARRKGQIDTVLNSLDEERLRIVQAVCAKPRAPMNRQLLREDSAYLSILTQNTINVDDVLGTAGKTLVFLNNTFQSTRTRKMAAARISVLRKAIRELGENAQQADAMLIELLKWGPGEIIPYLRKQHADKLELIDKLENRIVHLDRKTPKDVLEEFIRTDFGEKSPSLEQDLAFLKHLDGISMSSLDQLFTRNDGTGYETDKLRNAMWVNMRSLMIDDVRRKRPEFDGLKPSQIVAELAGKARMLDPVVKAYNALSLGS